MAQSIRISDDFYELAQAISARTGRSLAQQLEYWGRLGARVDLGLTASQALALLSESPDIPALADRVLVQTEVGDAHAAVVARHAKHEAEVAAGQRNAASLVVIPKRLARSAKLTYPKDAFGGATTW